MYAIVDIAGQQYKVSKSDKIVTAKLQGEKGSQVEFEKVLLLSKGKETRVGTPFVEGVKIQATIVDHGKAEKVIVFKKKRRKGYKAKRGHRQQQTFLVIDKIVTQ